MAVYIDDMQTPYRGMLMCHMIADSQEELLTMAKTIGMSTKWIQKKGKYNEHFDVCQTYKRRAVSNGAIAITRRDLVKILKARPGHPDNLKTQHNG